METGYLFLWGAARPGRRQVVVLGEAVNPEGRHRMSATRESCGVEAIGIPGCEILRTLNEGGMGKVYLARQHALNRFVCVKVLSIPAGEDPERCRCRFNREAELLASVSHPHILSIFDFGTTTESGLPFLVTEYIEGGDLRRFMNAGKPMPVGQARSILLQVGEALTYLHSKGILHRDLKPENVLMPTSSLVKVGDLGIAVLRDEAGVLTKSSRGMGTVGYVSPEQQYGLKVDERTDQYSLAALAYELLTGRRPLGLFPPPSRLNRDLSRAGRSDPAGPVGRTEGSVRQRSGIPDGARPGPDRDRRGRVRRLSLALIGLLAILAMASAMAWISMRETPDGRWNREDDGASQCLEDPAGHDCGPATKRDGPRQFPAESRRAVAGIHPAGRSCVPT